MVHLNIARDEGVGVRCVPKEETAGNASSRVLSLSPTEQ